MTDRPTIVLRAACDHQIGTGHLRRCLTLAERLTAAGAAATILTDDTALARTIAGDAPVPTAFRDPTDLGLPDSAPEVIVVDAPPGPHGLWESAPTLRRLADLDAAGTAVVALGHAPADFHPLRAVIDLYPTRQVRAMNYLEGPEFLVLRPAFAGQRDRQRGRDRAQPGVVVGMGGSDPLGLTAIAVSALAAIGWSQPVHVIAPADAGPAREAVRKAAAAGLAVDLHHDLSAEAVAEVMARSALAVLAFGTMAHEAMALGLPVLALTHYRWQVPSARMFEDLGAMVHLGCAEETPTLPDLGGRLAVIAGDWHRLRAMAATAASLVDGRGADRVADLVLQMAAESGRRDLDLLYVLAHPGDEVFGCGGTLLKQVRAGQRVGVMFLGDGSAGRFDRRDPAGQVHAAGRALAVAMQASMDRLGIRTWYYCRFADNRFDGHDLLDLVRTVETVVARHRPRTVYTHHPGDLNIDHRRTFEATVTALRPSSTRPSRTRLAPRLVSVEVPSSTDWGLGMGDRFAPNWYEDVSEVLADKLALADVYRTEIRDPPHPRSRAGLEARARMWGHGVGVRAAEAFVLHRHVNSDPAWT